MDPDGMARVYAASDRFFETRLGPDIAADAARYCPVFGGENSTATPESIAMAGPDYQPGALRDSIESHLNGHTLIVAATGSDQRSYAYWVETGHRIVVFGYDTGRSKDPQPFLRPALFQVRSY